MPKITIDQAGLIGVGGLNDPSYEKQSPDLTVANALAQQGGMLGQAADNLITLGTDAVKAYKKAKDADYVSNSIINATQVMNDFTEQEKVNSYGKPEGYTKRVITNAESTYSKLLKDAPSIEAQRVLKTQLDQQRLSLYTSSSDFEKKAVVQDRLGKYQNQTNILSNSINGNIDNLDMVLGQNNQLLDSLRLSGVDKGTLNKLQQDSSRKFSMSLLQGMQPKDALTLLSTGAFDATFEQQEIASITKDLNRSIKDALMQSDIDAKRAKEEMSANVKMQIYKGNMTESGLDTLFNAGKVDATQYNELIGAFNSEVRKKAEKSASISMIGDIIQSGKGIDVTDKNMVDYYDSYYKDIFSESIAGLDPQDRQLAVLDFVDKSGAIPSALKSEIVGTLNSSNLENRLQAANMVTGLSEKNPALLRGFKDEDVAYAVKYNRLANVMPLEDAAVAASNQVFKKDEPVYKAKLKAFEETKTPFNPSVLNTDPYFGDAPEELPVSVKRRWEEAYQSYAVDFNLTNDEAIKAADDKIKTLYGVTNINGKAEYMESAPESIYGIKGIDNNWIREQLIQETSDTLGRQLNVDENVQVAPVTATLKSKTPQYVVFITREDGAPDIVTDSDGTPFIWRPDGSQIFSQEVGKARAIKDSLINSMIIQARQEVAENQQ